MANLLKGRDAKPWVYHPAARDQDSQVAEDKIIPLLTGLVICQARFIGMDRK